MNPFHAKNEIISREMNPISRERKTISWENRTVSRENKVVSREYGTNLAGKRNDLPGDGFIFPGTDVPF
jgi:hypothetical protein